MRQPQTAQRTDEVHGNPRYVHCGPLGTLKLANAIKLLERMRVNPRDWRMDDIVTVCDGFGIACTAPRKGSHFKVKHTAVIEILTIPAHRPIKPIYIRDLIKFIDAVQGAKA